MIYGIKEVQHEPFMENHLNLGGENQRMKIGVTNRYFTLNDLPWMPIMGEFHYVRVAPENWERELLKMKAGGISVIAAYVFWIYHEEQEGVYRFEGNRDLKHFVQLCQKHGLMVCLRIGPWAHGEVRNGGFPDWLIDKGYKLRSNDEGYLREVKRYYKAICNEIKEYLFEHEGNIVALQLENELTHDAKHLFELKKIAGEVGLIAPIYTVTGWNSAAGARIPEKEVVPVFGGYPEAPWEDHTMKLPPSSHYFFLPERNDSSIGKDLAIEEKDESKNDENEPYQMKYSWYPYATCELGGGIEVTYKRRPRILPEDVAAISLVELGCGNNLPGYYMYHGGRNLIGEYSTLQESKATGYPNDYPIIDYDFQAALGANGEVRRHYRLFKLLHLWIQTEEKQLATMLPYFEDPGIWNREDKENLRYSVRHNGKSGYVFVNNYQRLDQLKSHKAVQFEIPLLERKLIFPRKGLTVENGAYFALPFYLELSGFNCIYATTQFITYHGDAAFFFQPYGLEVEYAFKTSDVAYVEGEVSLESEGEITYIVPSHMGKEKPFTLYKGDGSLLHIVTLRPEEAEHFYRLESGLYIVEGDLYQNAQEIVSYHLGNTDLSFYKWEKQEFVKHSNMAKEKQWTCKAEMRKDLPLDEKIDHLPYFEKRGKMDYTCYEIEICEEMLEDIEEAYLEIDYIGDVIAVYVEGKLFMDQFYYGEPLMLSIRQLLAYGTKVVFVITALGKTPIYLEVNRQQGCQLKHIHYIPLYQRHVCLT